MSNTSEQNESQHTEAKSFQVQRVQNTLDKWSQPEKKLPKANFLVTLSEAIFGKQAIINSANTSSVYMIIHYVLRLAILVLCLVGCFAQIITIVRLFFNYPAIVFVDLHPMEKLHLPSITTCNENRVMRSKLKAYDAQFANEWSKLINQTNKKANKLVQQQLIDNLIRTMLSNLTVTQFMAFGNTADDFLDVNFFKCASDKNHPNQKCISLSNLLTTAQENGNCFTLFHKSTSTELEDIAINSGLSESAVVRGSINESVNIESSLKPFAPNEIIRLRVNFHEEEYTTLNEPVSGRFIIHDNRNIAVIREKSYRIEPGKYYIFYLIKITDELLPEPYFTDCRDYRITDDSAELESQNKTGNLLLNAPSSKSNCIIGCIARKTVSTCNCWPPELPFLFTADENSSTDALKWCDWRERPPIENLQEKPASLTWFQYCFNVHETECNRICKPDCSIDRFQITKEEIDWPSQERIDRSEEKEKDEFLQLQACCAVISIRYWTAEQKINKYKPRFEIAEFTSYIGGLLSMWLGFSLFGFYGLSEKTIVRIVNNCLEKRGNLGKASTATIARLSGINQMLDKQNMQAMIKSGKVEDLPHRRRHTPLIRRINNWRSIY